MPPKAIIILRNQKGSLNLKFLKIVNKKNKAKLSYLSNIIKIKLRKEQHNQYAM